MQRRTALRAPHPGAAFVVLCLGCTGSIGDGLPSRADGEAPAPGRPGSGGRAAERPAGGQGGGAPEREVLGETPLQRLSSLEWVNTVADALPELDIALPRGDLPVDESIAGFEGQGSRPLDAAGLTRYVEVAETVAQAVAARAPQVLGACIQGNDPGGCMRAWLTSRLPILFRRAVEGSEVDGILRETFDAVRAAHGLSLAIEATVLRVLLAPAFLYKLERTNGPAGDAQVLDGDAIAARLSYFLWRSAPDAELRALARDGRLTDPDVLVAQGRRLLDHPRGRETVRRFGRAWLHLDETRFPGKSAYPEFSPALKAQMFAETDRFLDHVLREGQAPWTDLYTARYSFATPELAALYGVPGGGPDLPRVELDGAPDRAGLLTHAAFLAQHSHFDDPRQAIHRGLTVRTQLLCLPVPAPENVDTTQQLDRLAAGNACSSCHLQFENIGLGFERFDGLGRFNPGAPAPRGELRDLDGADHVFASVQELGRLLAGSEEARACVARQAFRFALGRAEADGESAVRDATDSLGARGDVRAMLERLVRAPAFTRRRAAPAATECTP